MPREGFLSANPVIPAYSKVFTCNLSPTRDLAAAEHNADIQVAFVTDDK